MFDTNATIEGFLRLFVLMLPMALLLLLVVAGHLVGGALKIHQIDSQRPDPTDESEPQAVQSPPFREGVQRDSQPTHAA